MTVITVILFLVLGLGFASSFTVLRPLSFGLRGAELCVPAADTRRWSPTRFSLQMSLDKGPGQKDKGPPKRKAPKDDVVQVDGKVIESLPNAMFRVEIQPSKQMVLCTISGKIRKNFVRVVVGDAVVCELSAYDLTRGRITYRSK